MTEVVGVRFKEVGKIYYFAPNSIKLKLGDYVIVETARGVECGQIAMTNRKINDDDIVHPLKKIIRKANEEDILRIEENRKKEKEAFKIKLLPYTFYLPAYDTMIWKGEKYKHYNMDLSSFYENRLAHGDDISQIIEDIRSRIQLLLTEHKGLEDWTVLGALLVRTYDSQEDD